MRDWKISTGDFCIHRFSRGLLSLYGILASLVFLFISKNIVIAVVSIDLFCSQKVIFHTMEYIRLFYCFLIVTSYCMKIGVFFKQRIKEKNTICKCVWEMKKKYWSAYLMVEGGGGRECKNLAWLEIYSIVWKRHRERPE